MVMALARETNDATDYDEAEGEFRTQLELADELDAPGHNVEVFGGKIVMSPFSRWSYAKPMKSVLQQLGANAPKGYDAMDAPFKFVFPTSHGALGPDIYVVDLDVAENDTPFAPSESLALVAELTSPATRNNDLTDKLSIYGRSIPVYLLFDMKQGQVTVYTDPSERGYRTHTTVPFGKPVQIPEPFDFELDTSAFTD